METDRLLSDECSYRVHMNNPKIYRKNKYDTFNKPEILFIVKKILCFSKFVLIIMSIF